MSADLHVNVSTDTIVENIESPNSEFDISQNILSSKLNPYAKPFEVFNKNRFLDALAFTHHKGNMIHSHGIEMTNGTDAEVFNGVEKVPVSAASFNDSFTSAAILDCTPLIIDDAMTPDMSIISNSSTSSNKNLEPSQNHISEIRELSLMVRGG